MEFPSNILNTELVTQRYHCQSAYPLDVFDVETFLDEFLEGVPSIEPISLTTLMKKSEFLKLLFEFVYDLTAQNVYLSPIKAINHVSHRFYVFSEREILEVFKFMLESILPQFKFREEYIALIIYEINKTGWNEEEAEYKMGKYFLRKHFMETDLSKYLRNRKFSHSLVNYIYGILNWSIKFNCEAQQCSECCCESPFKCEQDKKPENILFKNVVLSSNLAGSLPFVISKKFLGKESFEKSLDDILS